MDEFLQSVLSVSPGSDSTDALVSWFCDNSPQSVYKLAKSCARANTAHYLLVPVYVGDKPGGIWLSPTSRRGTGGFLNPCVWPSVSPPLDHCELQGCCGQTEWQGLELVLV